MAYEIETNPALQALVVHFGAAFKTQQHVYRFAFELRQALNDVATPQYVIALVDDLRLTPDIMLLFLQVTVRADYAVFKHPNLRQLVFVSLSGQYEPYVRVLNTPLYGNLVVPLFNTMSAAEAHVRGSASISS